MHYFFFCIRRYWQIAKYLKRGGYSHPVDGHSAPVTPEPISNSAVKRGNVVLSTVL